MLGLLYKDLMVMKKDLIYTIFEILGSSIFLFLPWGKMLAIDNIDTEMINEYTMTFIIMPFVTYMLVFQMISMVQGNLFAHDERKVWSSYIISSPVGRNGQVLSKYYMVLALSFVGFVWGMICDTISMLISGIHGSAMIIYTMFFFGQILFRAIELPFLIRFGQKHGRDYKMLVFAIAVFALILYALFGKLPEELSMEALVAFILKLSTNQAALSTTVLGVVALCPYIIMLLYYLSYKISCRLYQKGVEAYDA